MAIMDSMKGSSLTDVPCALREARMLSRSARCRLHLTQVGLSSRKEAAIFSAFSFPNSFSHMVYIHSGILYRREGVSKVRFSFSLEMVRSTPFTKPLSPEK